MTNKFCSIDDVKGRLNIADSSSSDDPIILAEIVEATSLLRAYTRREWTRGTYVDYFSVGTTDISIMQGRGFQTYHLRERNVTPDAPAPVVHYSRSGQWDGTAPLSPTAYSIDTRLSQIIIYPAKTWVAGRSLRVSYTAGFDVDPVDATVLGVPQNVRSACATQAAHHVRGILNETSGTKQKQDRKGLANYANTTSGLIADALALVKSETRILTGR